MTAQSDRETSMHHYLDALNWPVLGISVAMWPWMNDLLTHIPGPTAVYMGISATFMLFQMSDKLGLLERFKRRPKSEKP